VNCVRCPATAVVTRDGVHWCRPCSEGITAAERQLLRCEVEGCRKGAEHTCDQPLRDFRREPRACLRYVCEEHAQPFGPARDDLHLCPEHTDFAQDGASVAGGFLQPNRASRIRAWLRRKRDR
jgi:hypothetical protein